MTAVLALALAGGCAPPVHLERRFAVMGTYASAEVYARTREGAERALEEIRRGFEEVDASMSNWREDSELSRLNRAAGGSPWAIRDVDLYRCILMATQYARATRGAFDPTVGPLMRLWGFRPLDPRVPEEAAVAEALRHVGWEKVEIVKGARLVRFKDPGVELDLGGIAKGYALDVAARAFSRIGCVAGLLDLGGGLYAWNHPPDREAWSVGVRDPLDPSRIMATVRLVNRAVATSGDYENSFTVAGRSYGHIMDPRTGRPAESDVVAATVIADSGADADALSTAIFVAGSGAAGDYLRRARRVEAILVVKGLGGTSLLLSASLEGRVDVDPEFERQVGGRVRYLLPPVDLEAAPAPGAPARLLD